MYFRRALLIALLLSLSGCARHYVDVPYDDPYGFFSGFWHGLIFPLTVCVNLLSWFLSLFGLSFLQGIEIIGRPNTGFFYYLGFLFGLSTAASSSPG